jgi:cathepsin D
VNGNSVSTDNFQPAAIDTGTTLVAGPTSVIQNIYSQIPGSAPFSESEGFFTYRKSIYYKNQVRYVSIDFSLACNSRVNVSLTFGTGKAWPISNDDFNHGSVGGGNCVGAFYAVDTQQGNPDWIVGDAFLKNVMSVYRYRPASVGFAQLANGITTKLASGPVPSASVSNDPNGAVSHLSLRSGVGMTAAMFVSIILGAMLLF